MKAARPALHKPILAAAIAMTLALGLMIGGSGSAVVVAQSLPASRHVAIDNAPPRGCDDLLAKLKASARAGNRIGPAETRAVSQCILESGLPGSGSAPVDPAAVSVPPNGAIPVACYDLGGVFWLFDDEGGVNGSGEITIWGAWPGQVIVSGSYFGTPSVFSLFYFTISAAVESSGFPLGAGIGLTIGESVSTVGWVGITPFNLTGEASPCVL